MNLGNRTVGSSELQERQMGARQRRACRESDERGQVGQGGLLTVSPQTAHPSPHLGCRMGSLDSRAPGMRERQRQVLGASSSGSGGQPAPRPSLGICRTATAALGLFQPCWRGRQRLSLTFPLAVQLRDLCVVRYLPLPGCLSQTPRPNLCP